MNLSPRAEQPLEIQQPSARTMRNSSIATSKRRWTVWWRSTATACVVLVQRARRLSAGLRRQRECVAGEQPHDGKNEGVCKLR